MSKSTRSCANRKPAKPYPNFPLYAVEDLRPEKFLALRSAFGRRKRGKGTLSPAGLFAGARISRVRFRPPQKCALAVSHRLQCRRTIPSAGDSPRNPPSVDARRIQPGPSGPRPPASEAGSHRPSSVTRSRVLMGRSSKVCVRPLGHSSVSWRTVSARPRPKWTTRSFEA
jgi:hypothetical protein